MAFEKSQSYNVDNRYTQAKGVPDDTAGPRFLQQYLEGRRSNAKFPVTMERLGDDRFVFAGQGGTIPVGSLPYEPRGAAGFNNTDSAIGFRNSFRASQA